LQDHWRNNYLEDRTLFLYPKRAAAVNAMKQKAAAEDVHKIKL